MFQRYELNNENFQVTRLGTISLTDNINTVIVREIARVVVTDSHRVFVQSQTLYITETFKSHAEVEGVAETAASTI